MPTILNPPDFDILVFVTNVAIGYPALRLVIFINCGIGKRVTHKSVISPVQRNIREPRFTSPLREKVEPRTSMSLPLLNLGLCKSSSGSAMSGDKFEPHCLGSGWRENCGRRSTNVRKYGRD